MEQKIQHHLKMMSWSHKCYTKHALILIATLKVYEHHYLKQNESTNNFHLVTWKYHGYIKILYLTSTHYNTVLQWKC